MVNGSRPRPSRSRGPSCAPSSAAGRVASARCASPTDRRRLHVQVGPYVVLGRYHGPLGATSLRSFAERDPMVPLTDATIAYVVGGVLEVVDAPTLIINRELAAWYREAEEASETSLASLGQAGRRPPSRPRSGRAAAVTGPAPKRRLVCPGSTHRGVDPATHGGPRDAPASDRRGGLRASLAVRRLWPSAWPCRPPRAPPPPAEGPRRSPSRTIGSRHAPRWSQSSTSRSRATRS